MRPYTRSIVELFDGKKRYLIPLYQRQYAWSVSPQLELLWEDIERAVIRLAEDRQSATPHFMGAIVIAQIKTFGKQVQAFEVIDGQQRLTTFQILLAALRDVAAAHGSDYAQEINKLLFNDGVMETPEVERFKLWPTLTDRRAFVFMTDPAADLSAISKAPEDEDGVVRPAAAAHAWFKARVEEHVIADGAFDQFRMEKLFEALRDGLAAVSIELEGGDDPQTIFETLNSRGVDLTAGDLMRNFIFQRAKGLGQEDGSLKVDKLYADHWLPLDRWFWRIEDSRGRQNKPRLDWLLVDHLSMKKAEIVSVDNLFDSYRRWIFDERPFDTVEAELRSISRSAEAHRRLVEMKSDDPLGRFGRFARAFDVSTAMPLVLYLATDAEIGGDLAPALDMIEAYILRRDICGLTTKNYNRQFVDVLDKIRKSGLPTLKALEAHLSISDSDLTRWPNDAEWKQNWLGRDQYKNNRQPRLRHLLQAIEMAKRSALSEEIEIKSELTIEHVMPDKWRTHWPVPGFDHVPEGEFDQDHFARQLERDQAVNKLGNLTLLTQSLNSTVSNGPFALKMPAVRAHASLALNRELHSYDHWDETSILHRGEAMFEIAKQVWRGPLSREAAVETIAAGGG
ncbi:DUF262 domain-containing protein [Brevundimonas mediterranea]|uniref:DUF262 domain-containing protein n=1 Tax=Brevundimonas mediterranea TaxID=74329 RepID=A0A7W6A4P1_9CAUL|nr:DUF262 domain-containing protein [Brevundimonas mediterranea]MBB3873288.1 hypothetical protein [Brevundimonas mediterranea]